MADQQQKMGKKEKDKKKGCAKKGRNSRRCSRYRDLNRREINKLKRVIQSNGGDAALAWASKNGNVTTTMLKSLRTLKPRAFQRAIQKSPAFARAVGAK